MTPPSSVDLDLDRLAPSLARPVGRECRTAFAEKLHHIADQVGELLVDEERATLRAIADTASVPVPSADWFTHLVELVLYNQSDSDGQAFEWRAVFDHLRAETRGHPERGDFTDCGNSS